MAALVVGAVLLPANPASADSPTKVAGAFDCYSYVGGGRVGGGTFVVNQRQKVVTPFVGQSGEQVSEVKGWVRFVADNGTRRQYATDYTLTLEWGGGGFKNGTFVQYVVAPGSFLFAHPGDTSFGLGGYSLGVGGTVTDICTDLGYDIGYVG